MIDGNLLLLVTRFTFVCYALPTSVTYIPNLPRLINTCVFSNSRLLTITFTLALSAR